MANDVMTAQDDGASGAEVTDGRVLDIRDLRVVHPGRGRQRGSDVVAVDGVSLHVDAGEFVGLVGESGSGKSTLALAAADLGRRTSGEISILGQDLARLRGRRSRKLRAQVQVVFQDPHGSLDPRQSVRSGLQELRKLHPSRTDWITDEALMDRVGLDESMLAHLPHEISGGQAQRVSIARALLLQPRLLVADEPTSGLDVSVQAQILNLLLDLCVQDRIAILFISHDLSVVRHTCDRLYVMKDGVVVEHGATEQVLDAPRDEYTKRLIAAIPGRDRARLGGAISVDDTRSAGRDLTQD